MAVNESRQAVSQRFGRDSFETRSTPEFLGGIAQMRDAVLEGGRNVAADLYFQEHIAGGGGWELGHTRSPASYRPHPGGAVAVLPAGGSWSRPAICETTGWHVIMA